MRGISLTLAGTLVLIVSAACESSDEDSAPAAAQVADLSQFPTPTRSQAQPRPTSPPPVVQSQPDQNEGNAVDTAPMTQEEIQQLRQQLQSGQLSEEEAQRAIQRLRAQFGGGQGGPFGGDAGSVAVGSIENIGENAITIKAELGSVTASVGEDTDVRITSVLKRAELTAGSQIRVFSERVEGATLARLVTIVPEGGGQGGFGAGQGNAGPRALSGTIETVTDTGFLLETQQGPLPVDMNDESVIIQTRQGTIDDLETGMLARVMGPTDEDGRIEARLITVTPDGLEGIPSFGSGNRGGAGRLGGGNW